MSEKTKHALAAGAIVLLVAFVTAVGYFSLRDNSQPTISPSYQKLSPEERTRIRAEGLARRNGMMRPNAAAPATSSAGAR